jgi:hypothetical protein
VTLELLLFAAGAISAAIGLLLDLRGRSDPGLLLLLAVGLVAVGLAVQAA